MIEVQTYNGRGWPILDAYSKFKFPSGELQVTVKMKEGDFANIVFEFENNEEIIELLLIADAIKRAGGTINNLHIDYVPFARQDRVANVGECFSLKVFADLINSIHAKHVFVIDPHSDVTTALIDNIVVTTQAEIVRALFDQYKNLFTSKFIFISPDGGALKKIHKVVAKVPFNVLEVVECSKDRDTLTGAIKETIVHKESFAGESCIIIDDICDGGMTFIEIAKVLKAKGAGKVILIVTHGLFTKGLEVFDGLIDKIYTRKGKVK